MKNLVLLFLAAVLLTSCENKKKETDAAKEEVKDKYALILDAIYEKDDSISVIYEKDNYFKYDKPISYKIKGSPAMQRLVIDFPEGEAVENISFVMSTNKDQPYVTMKNISVKNGDLMVLDGDNYKHSAYFLPDSSFSWDLKNSRFNISRTGKYPPAMVGSEQLKALLVK